MKGALRCAVFGSEPSDSQRSVFRSATPFNGNELHIVDVTTGRLQTLPDTSSANFPTWVHPDLIAFTREGRRYHLRLGERHATVYDETRAIRFLDGDQALGVVVNNNSELMVGRFEDDISWRRLGVVGVNPTLEPTPPQPSESANGR